MRLIDADELVRKEIAFVCGPRSGGKTLAMIHSAIRHIVDNAPTVIAEPVRHGKWITKDVGFLQKSLICSACGGWEHNLAYKHEGMNYCPNCGAKMED